MLALHQVFVLPLQAARFILSHQSRLLVLIGDGLIFSVFAAACFEHSAAAFFFHRLPSYYDSGAVLSHANLAECAVPPRAVIVTRLRPYRRA
jgi:hypothetical protein